MLFRSALHRADPNPDKVSRLIDIQAKLAADKGAGYERWAKVFNLKQLSKSVTLLSEHGVSTEAELAQRIAELQSQYSEALAVVKDLENRIDENRELSRHVSTYLQNRKVAQQSKHNGNSVEYQETHCAELTAYQAAAAYFKAHNIQKLFQAGQFLDIVSLEIGGCRLISCQLGAVLFSKSLRVLCCFGLLDNLPVLEIG